MTFAIARTGIRPALEPLRAREWWEHKLSPLLGTGYMTAFNLRASLLDLWPTLLATLAGIAAAAAYVSLINDLTDLGEDAAAGKYNRLARRPAGYAPSAIAAVLAVGTAVGIVAWRDDPLALALYAGSWLAFSLYSLPPFRLKTRGAAGVLADAAGAHLFPQALIAVAVFHATGRPIEGVWLAAVVTWSLVAGIRGALWHQLGDVEADSRSGAKTFGRLHPVKARFAGYAAFAIELAAFSFLLWRAGGLLAFALLVPYLLLELARVQLWGGDLIVVSPAPRFRIAMHEYYMFFYPLAFLAASSIRHPRDVAMLLLHLALFRNVALGVWRDVKNAVRSLVVIRRTPAAVQAEPRRELTRAPSKLIGRERRVELSCRPCLPHRGDRRRGQGWP